MATQREQALNFFTNGLVEIKITIDATREVAPVGEKTWTNFQKALFEFTKATRELLNNFEYYLTMDIVKAFIDSFGKLIGVAQAWVFKENSNYVQDVRVALERLCNCAVLLKEDKNSEAMRIFGQTPTNGFLEAIYNFKFKILEMAISKAGEELSIGSKDTARDSIVEIVYSAILEFTEQERQLLLGGGVYLKIMCVLHERGDGDSKRDKLKKIVNDLIKF